MPPMPPVRRFGVNVNASPPPGVVYVGVDPGASGGLAGIYPSGTLCMQTFAGATVRDLRRCFEQVQKHAERQGLRVVASIEKVGGYVGMGEGAKGGGAANGTAMFKFGTSYGMLLMALECHGFSSQEVMAAEWQKALGVTPRKKAKKERRASKGKPAQKAEPGEPKYRFKKRLREFAEKLFPHVEVCAETADALLIAEFTRRLHTGVIAAGA